MIIVTFALYFIALKRATRKTKLSEYYFRKIQKILRLYSNQQDISKKNLPFAHSGCSHYKHGKGVMNDM